MTLKPADLGAMPNNAIGRSEFSVDPYFDGMIDEFGIYNRGLTSSEELSINWTVRKKPSQGLGRRWGEVRESTSRTRDRSRPAPESLSRRVHLWTRREIATLFAAR